MAKGGLGGWLRRKDGSSSKAESTGIPARRRDNMMEIPALPILKPCLALFGDGTRWQRASQGWRRGEGLCTKTSKSLFRKQPNHLKEAINQTFKHNKNTSFFWCRKLKEVARASQKCCGIAQKKPLKRDSAPTIFSSHTIILGNSSTRLLAAQNQYNLRMS